MTQTIENNWKREMSQTKTVMVEIKIRIYKLEVILEPQEYFVKFNENKEFIRDQFRGSGN